MMNDSSPFSLPESADETARRHHHLYEEAQSYPTEQPGTMTLDSDMIHSGETFGGTIDDDNHCNNDKANAARGFDLSQPANKAVVALCLVVLAVIAAIVVALLYATDFVLDRKDGLVPTPAPPVLRPPLRPSPRPSPRPSAQPFALVKWFRVGSDIIGETRYDRFGSALAMSSNGTVLLLALLETTGAFQDFTQATLGYLISRNKGGPNEDPIWMVTQSVTTLALPYPCRETDR